MITHRRKFLENKNTYYDEILKIAKSLRIEQTECATKITGNKHTTYLFKLFAFLFGTQYDVKSINKVYNEYYIDMSEISLKKLNKILRIITNQVYKIIGLNSKIGYCTLHYQFLLDMTNFLVEQRHEITKNCFVKDEEDFYLYPTKGKKCDFITFSKRCKPVVFNSKGFRLNETATNSELKDKVNSEFYLVMKKLVEDINKELERIEDV